MFSPKAFVLGSVLALAPSVVAAVPPTFSWHDNSQFTSDEESGSDVAFDKDGNLFVGTGLYNSTTYTQFALRKLNKDGGQIWSKKFQNFGPEVTRVITDSDGSVIFLTANQRSQVDSGANSHYQWFGFFGKYSSVGGAVFSGWDRRTFNCGGSSRAPLSVGMATDSERNIIIAVPFDQLSYGQTLSGQVDIALMKLSPTGDLIWLRRVNGGAPNIPTSVVVDSEANIYMSGYNLDVSAFEGTIVQSNGGADGFIAKYDKNGVLKWIQRPTCSGDDKISGLVLSEGKLWFLGTFAGNISFGSTANLSNSGLISYIGTMDLSGQFQTAAKIGGSVIEAKIAPFKGGTVVYSGYFTGTSIAGVTVQNRGSTDVFLANLQANGTTDWVKTFGFLDWDVSGGIATSSTGEIAVSATVRGGVTLDEEYISGSGNADTIVAKLVDPSVINIPKITLQPTDRSAFFGNSVSFQVNAQSGVPITIQWFLNGSPLVGETNVALFISSVSLGQEGRYYAEIKNQFGTVRSESVRLIVSGDAPVLVTTIAGTNTAGFVDSTVPAQVRLSGPNSLAIQGDGTVVFPDSANFAVRMMEPTGAVGTLAGRPPGVAGLSNGPASVALFALPLSVAIDPAWDIFVADAENHMVRKISAFGVRAVSTVAGTGVEGFQNGPGAQAKFAFPNDLVTDGSGNVYVTEFRGHRVRRIAANGTVTTFAGNGTRGHRDGEAQQAMFSDLGGIARDSLGNLYVTEWGNDDIRKITPEGMVSTIAGTPGQRGFVDGPGLSGARLGAPDAIAVDNRGNIFFTEFSNSSVRRIDPSGEVFTLVGSAGRGFRDGDRASAQMNQPGGIAAHPDGSLLVADSYNHAIRRVVWQTNSAPTEATLLVELNPAITIFGVAGRTYRIESSENLVGGPWIVVGEVMLASPVETWFDTQPATRAQRYYRAILK